MYCKQRKGLNLQEKAMKSIEVREEEMLCFFALYIENYRERENGKRRMVCFEHKLLLFAFLVIQPKSDCGLDHHIPMQILNYSQPKRHACFCEPFLGLTILFYFFY